MSVLLERLITAVAPLLTAVAGKRKKPVKKRAARKPTHAALSRKERQAVKPRKHVTSRVPVSGRKNQQIRLTRPGAPAPPVEPERKPFPPSGRAILISPENGKYVDTLNPNFRWLSVGGATRYEVWWGEENHGNATQTLISISTEAAVPVERPLRIGATYLWRVRGGNEAGWGPWSPSSTFRVAAESFTA